MKILLILYSILPLSSCFNINQLYGLNGFELGSLTFSTGLLLDNTIAKKSLDTLKNKNNTLYNVGMSKSFTNLMLVGPTYYTILEKNMVLNIDTNLHLTQITSLVFIHSLGYYLAHRLMHRSDLFRKYHHFHHTFNETLIPSIGNAVSIEEFSFAYMLPFIVGFFYIQPNLNSFKFAILIVSFMNLIIHTQELNDLDYNPYFVSPKIHSKHHNGTNIRNTYSAPTFNLEYMYDIISKNSK